MLRTQPRRNLIPVSANPERIPIRSEPEQSERLDEETKRILAERLELNEPAEPWAVVKKRILERKPMP